MYESKFEKKMFFMKITAEMAGILTGKQLRNNTITKNQHCQIPRLAYNC